MSMLLRSFCLFVLLCAQPFQARALEIRGAVAAVEAGGQVRITLPAGAVVAAGDEVRIEAELPGIGPVPIRTRWRVKQTGAGFALADPEGAPSGTPQAGYAAVIETSAPQTAATGPAATSAVQAARQPARQPPEHECDRLAGSPQDPDSVGAGVAFNRINAAEAIRACRSAVAAHPGTARFEFQLGRALGRMKDYKSAASWYRMAADKGNAGAMNNLGNQYHAGRGVGKDPVEALKWYRQAAEKGIGAAMSNLGVLYDTGQGVGRDPVEALKWYRKAADKGIDWGMYKIGAAYLKGKGIAKDELLAIRWLRKAADKGVAPAMHVLGDIFETGRGVSKNQKRAAEWYTKAAEKGYAPAMNDIASAYDNGEGVEKNPKIAAGYIYSAILKGSAEAIEEMTANNGAWSPAMRRELQWLMQNEGFYKGPIDGKMGPSTIRAMKAMAKK